MKRACVAGWYVRVFVLPRKDSVVNTCTLTDSKEVPVAIPVADRGDPYDCETSRLSHFLDSQLIDGGELVSLTRRQAALYALGRILVLIYIRS
jgi:hypothetical protein